MVGRARGAKAPSHARLLDMAAARSRRDGIHGLAVAGLMKDAGLTYGGFYRHFDSREQLVAEAAQRALSQGSAWTIAAGQLGGERGYTAPVDGHPRTCDPENPRAGCGVARAPRGAAPARRAAPGTS